MSERMTAEIVKSEVVQVDGATEHARRIEAQREVIKRSICPKGISDDEFILFLEQCKRSGLDPLLKEAFCVPRRQKIGENQWGTKHEFQPSEAGMLARAERFPDYRGIQASAVYAEDDIVVDQGEGTVTHRFNPAKRKGQLVGAWARVVRDNKLPVVVWLDFSGYVQQTPLWSKIPTTMIEKCARVAALRKAYPEAFGGLYIAEEMPASEPEEAKTEKRKAPPPPPEDPPSLAETNVIDAQFRKAAEQVTGTALEPPEEEMRVIIGRHKGKALAMLDSVSLQQAIDDAAKVVDDPANRSKRSYPKAARAHAALLAERDRNKHQTGEPTPAEKAEILAQEMAQAEPGSEG